MKAKWHFSAFIIILSLLGISIQHVSVPNQEIVVQFANDTTPLETQNTIAAVKKQLRHIGVENIKVHQKENNSLKITYHSTIDVASIKKIFSSENKLDIGLSIPQKGNSSEKSPSKKDSNTFQLLVNKIQKNDGSNGGFNGLALEIKPKTDRIFIPDLFCSSVIITLPEKKYNEELAYLTYKKVFIFLNKSSHNIPEVRAGPTSI